jgi:hypothetical protein
MTPTDPAAQLDPEERRRLLAEAHGELQRIRERYRELPELVPIFTAMDRAVRGECRAFLKCNVCGSITRSDLAGGDRRCAACGSVIPNDQEPTNRGTVPGLVKRRIYASPSMQRTRART